jgi:hypothetical protein
MKSNRIPAILVIGFATAMISGNAPKPEDGPIKATPTDIKAKDLAWALGMDVWSYHLKFDKPIQFMQARPCELLRQNDGSWKRSYLPISVGMGYGEDRSEIDLEFYLMGEPGAKSCALSMSGTRQRGRKLENPPDLANMVTSPNAAQFLDGCLVLAYKVKGQEISFQKENLVYVLAIEIDTKDIFER